MALQAKALPGLTRPRQQVVSALPDFRAPRKFAASPLAKNLLAWAIPLQD